MNYGALGASSPGANCFAEVRAAGGGDEKFNFLDSAGGSPKLEIFDGVVNNPFRLGHYPEDGLLLTWRESKRRCEQITSPTRD
ncbi:MAG TPA: hypothetical protein VEY10_08735 [Flavisolibacter sp.]|nr:hypothetical protein [Flavisolibacter sp.]